MFLDETRLDWYWLRYKIGSQRVTPRNFNFVIFVLAVVELVETVENSDVIDNGREIGDDAEDEYFFKNFFFISSLFTLLLIIVGGIGGFCSLLSPINFMLILVWVDLSILLILALFFFKFVPCFEENFFSIFSLNRSVFLVLIQSLFLNSWRVIFFFNFF